MLCPYTKLLAPPTKSILGKKGHLEDLNLDGGSALRSVIKTVLKVRTNFRWHRREPTGKDF
jgi:hypothetical protein